MKKVGKTTRPFRYDLNQILYGYTVEVTNKFKGLDLIHKQELVEKSEVGQFSDLLCSVVRIIHQASFMLTSDNFGRASEFHDPSPQETLKHGT